MIKRYRSIESPLTTTLAIQWNGTKFRYSEKEMTFIKDVKNNAFFYNPLSPGDYLGKEYGKDRVNNDYVYCFSCSEEDFNKRYIAIEPENIKYTEKETFNKRHIIVDPEDKKYTTHKDLLDEMHQTYIQKDTAYGDAFDKSIQKYGFIAALTRMSDKFGRIENLILHPDVEKGDEALEDSLLDLANYAIMTVMNLQKNRK